MIPIADEWRRFGTLFIDMSQTTSYNFESSFDDNIPPLEEINGEEDAETYIHWLYESVVENQKDSQADEIIADTKSFITKRKKDTKSKSRENYYQQELFIQMKERIFALEEEIKYKNCLISNLVNKLWSLHVSIKNMIKLTQNMMSLMTRTAKWILQL